MKPCAQFKRPIAWLAAGVLENRHVEAVKAHLAACVACRQYMEELKQIVDQQLTTSAALEHVHMQVTAGYHARLKNRLLNQAQSKMTLSWNWKPISVVAPAALALLLCILFAALFTREQKLRSDPVVAQFEESPYHEQPTVAPKPTLARYNSLIHDSVDELDAALNEDAQRWLTSSENVARMLSRSLD